MSDISVELHCFFDLTIINILEHATRLSCTVLKVPIQFQLTNYDARRRMYAAIIVLLAVKLNCLHNYQTLVPTFTHVCSHSLSSMKCLAFDIPSTFLLTITHDCNFFLVNHGEKVKRMRCVF